MHDYHKQLLKIKTSIKTDAQIIGVSKYSSIEQIIGFYKAGLRSFGENRVDTLLEKNSQLISHGDICPSWHFVGKIQSKKIGKLFTVKNLDYLHSVDSLSLLEKLHQKSDRIENENGIDYFLQINISSEDEKSGFTSYPLLLEAYKRALGLKGPKLRVVGLMGMGRIRTETFESDAHTHFSEMKQYKEKLIIDLEEEFGKTKILLSMGMSNDYQIALDYGADFVRLGRCLFFDE